MSTVDSEFGRTTDPVRMYMREMGSVELLTREGEIEIAKRIEDGLRHMIQAISACPTTIAEILRPRRERSQRDEMRIDEVVDGLLDPNAEEIIGEEIPTRSVEEELDAESEDEDGSAVAERQPAAAEGGGAGALRHHRPALHQDDQGAGQARLAQQALPQGPGGHFRAS